MADLIEILADARRESRLIPGLPLDLVPADADAAYRVSLGVIARLGWPRAGWKVAATTAKTQARLRSSEPILGPVYRRFLMESPAELRHADLLVPLIECEFVFELGRDLPARESPYDLAEVAEAIGGVRPAIEVAECRFDNAHLPPVPGVLADGSGNGQLVLGPLQPDWRGADLASARVRLLVDGAPRREGSGADVLGDPLNVMVWLANRLSGLGEGLRAGEVVSTGTTTGMVPPRPGERHVGDFGALGQVSVAFT